ncbi:MAG TPA: outer membrane beta-barrel protein [Spirochaetota bacterium]|nr:outer membrane beta-barrel protein [Spirochaetota bacterium]HOH37537.1 outer membrane beta-barrel protein [Spirochaetota bacterium]HPW51899.1 outer membrane beta-barrel protein [Spirochaetota bacterium]HPY03379.1 outer membrane beta-barrel protein [Spirochaetota bacterium]HQA53008.1 outer membrane beta-barrel protein [Spirochaetota bacterium]
MKRKVVKLLMAVIMICTSSAAFAWPDGEKKGLLLGVTTGIANEKYETDYSNESGLGFMAGALVGYGFNDSFLLDFKYRYWYADIDSTVFHTWSWCADGMFFPVKNNGFFLNAGLGRALTLPDVSGAEAQGGMFFYAGAGYEITKWVFLSVDYGIGSYSNNIDGKTITFGISFIGY